METEVERIKSAVDAEYPTHDERGFAIQYVEVQLSHAIRAASFNREDRRKWIKKIGLRGNRRVKIVPDKKD